MLIPINSIILMKGLIKWVKILSVNGSITVHILWETISVLFHRPIKGRTLIALSLLPCSWLSFRNLALYYASIIRLRDTINLLPLTRTLSGRSATGERLCPSNKKSGDGALSSDSLASSAFLVQLTNCINLSEVWIWGHDKLPRCCWGHDEVRWGR